VLRAATTSATLLDTKAPCPSVIVQPWLDSFKALERTVSCPQVRVLAWAWDAHTRSGKSAGAVQRFLSWRCLGSDRQTLGTGGPPVYHRIHCSQGGNRVVFEA
jgi:hypothetical protein